MRDDCCPDLDVCDCDCHRFPGMMHCMPCCNTCPKCGKNIRVFSYDEHVKKCEAVANDFSLELFKKFEKELEICHCPCHSGPSVKHIMPCCLKCPHCGKNIKTLYYSEHIEQCRPDDCLTGLKEEELEAREKQLEAWGKIISDEK
ncbi:MAG: hypothetical protein Q7K65_03625 [Candidatus Buchananbacteria bacterium]|nr:hypothetical protein [Candidatus Buchananbacteria bacterium]